LGGGQGVLGRFNSPLLAGWLRSSRGVPAEGGAILSAKATLPKPPKEAAVAQASLLCADINAAAVGGHTPSSQQVA